MADEYAYTGYESAFVPTPSQDKNSQNVERKSEKSEKSKEQDKKNELFGSALGKNVLVNYRSYTYNFVLACLDKTTANDPGKYRKSELDLVILRSGGKGTEGIKTGNMTSADVYRNRSEAGRKEAEKKLNDQKMTEGFNAESPGKFDMYIDDVEIESTMAFTQQSGTSIATSLRFEIIEPYSINGFLEALQVNAVQAGYPNYAGACFLLKVQFVGYKDDTDLPDAEFIDKSERYFPFTFTSVEIEVTERGTKYRCTGVPYNEKAYGQPGKLKKSIKMVGENVREILEDLMENMNDQEKQNAKKSGKNPDYTDTYEVKFLKQSGSSWVDDKYGDIAESKLSEKGTENNQYQMPDPAQRPEKSAYKVTNDVDPSGDTKKEEIKYEPKKTVTQFPENVALHEVMAAVIRDSEYVANIIKTLPIDDSGFVEYFIVRTEVLNKSIIDPQSKRPYQTFRFVVTPWRVHYTNIPHLESALTSEKKLKRSVLREYNYLYTGMNTEIRNFRLNFNSLYFEAVPPDNGNKNDSSSKNAARPGGSSHVQGKDPTIDTESTVPQPAKRSDPSATSVLPPSGYNAALPKNDPYSVLAKSMHEKLLNSVSLATGEIEILGDPFFLVTGGIGNYNPKMVSALETDDGEVAHIRGQVLIAINFRNPIDINNFEQGGMFYFDSKRVPFSGVFMVTQVKSNFKDGFFNQRLNIVRIPGQLIDTNLQPNDPKDLLTTTENTADKVVPAETRAVDYGQRLEADLSVLERGLPDSENNFTASVGGLGGNDVDQMNQSFGGFSISEGLSSGSSPIGTPLPDDVLRNVRLSQISLADLSLENLESAAKVDQTIKNLFSYPNNPEVESLSNNLIANSIDNSLSINNLGSGIGEGSQLRISESDVKLTKNSLSYTNGIPVLLKQLSQSSVLGLKNNKVAGILGNSSNLINSKLGTVADPMAISSNVGIDASRVSGLGSILQSKVGDDVLKYKDVPEDVNLNQAVRDGLRLENLSAEDFANLPPTQPATKAPPPTVNEEYLAKVVAGGGVGALANYFGVSDVSKISQSLISKNSINSALENVSQSNINPYSNLRVNHSVSDLDSYLNKVQSSKSQLSSVTGQSFIRDTTSQGSVGSIFGSRSLGSNPLDKLVNNIENINTPSYTGKDTEIKNNLNQPPYGP